jgi:hypothetical protein
VEKAIEFIKSFINQEYKSLVVEKTERDNSKYLASAGELSGYCIPGLGLSFAGRRPFKPADDWFKTEKQAADELQPRRIFQIKHYKNPEYGDLFRCYVSETKSGNNTCFSCLYAAQVEGNLKIISKYNIDFKGGWINRGGKEIDKPGDLVEVRMFETPDRPDHMKAYESEFQDHD